MANYTKTTNFTSKDSLSTGNPLKIIRGSEHDTEYSNIATAIQTKADLASPALTGTATAVNITVSGNLLVGTDTVTTNTATQTLTNKTVALGSNTVSGTIAQFNTALTDGDFATLAGTETLTNKTISGGTITGITDLTVADGGTGASTFSANAVLLGNGTSSFQTVAPSTTGNVLTSNGTTWVSSSANVNYVKAWVNYQGGNGNTSGTINGSFNVSSITTNSTGNWTVNITNALANTNFAVQTSVNNSSSAGQNAIAYYGAKTTSTINVYCVTGSGGAALPAVDVSVTVFNS